MGTSSILFNPRPSPSLRPTCELRRAAQPKMTKAAQFIQVKVKPNAGASALRQDESGLWSAQLKSPPVDGKANAELVGLVAKHFGCHKSAVCIRSGSGARLKLVRIEVATAS